MRYIDFGNPNYTIIYDTDDYRIFTSAPQAYSSARKFADLTFDALCLYEEQGAGRVPAIRDKVSMDATSEASYQGFQLYEEYFVQEPVCEDGVWYDSDESEYFSVFVPEKEFSLYKKMKAYFNHSSQKWELTYQAYVPGYGYDRIISVENRDSLFSALEGAKAKYESFYC